MSQAVEYYVAKGVARDKIVVGIPLYGRSFLQTQGPGTSFSGVGAGSWEAGVYDYRALPLPGSYLHVDENVVSQAHLDRKTLCHYRVVNDDGTESSAARGDMSRSQSARLQRDFVLRKSK